MSISEIFHAASNVRSASAPRPQPAATHLPTLPEIGAGQLWLIEAPVAKGAPSAPLRHALDGANVVIYDRALAVRLAPSFPLGTYAEPAADGAAGRCVRFARDGWSVVRLMPPRLPQRERVRRVRDFVDELAAAKVPGALPVTVLAEAAYGIREATETRLDQLADTVATFARDTRLAIVVVAFAGGAARPQAVAANGLAG